jgi:hypothetical protein
MNELAAAGYVEADALELRILHGPQAGSTMPLEAGQAYTLGTADTCAVLLAGTQVEAEHAELTAEIDGIRVMPIEGRVMTIDRSEVQGGQTVALGTVLRLGRVKLTIDGVDAPWPHEDALEEPDVVMPAPTRSAAKEEQPAAPEVAPAKKAKARPAVRPRRRLLPSLLLGGAAALLAGAAVAAWITAKSAGQGEADDAAMPVASAAAAVVSPVPAAMAASATASASEAPILSEADRLALVTNFVEKRRVPGDVELNVEPMRAGAFRITGAVSTQAKLTAVTEAARSELATAGPVNFAVLLRSQLPERFEAQLRAAGLASKFKVIRREPDLAMQAVLTGQDVNTWEKMFADFARQYGSVLTIHAQVQQERDAVVAKIETVVGGAFPYVLTTDGRRLSPGGVLEGRTIAAIRDGELIFTDGARLRYGY